MKIKITGAAVLLLAITGSTLAVRGQTHASRPVVVASPDGKVRVELSAPGGVLVYRVLVDGKQVLAPSKLGIEADDAEFGRDVSLGAAKYRKLDERYRFFGAHAEALNRANEASVAVRSHDQSYFIDIHVANDGVGVRLRLPSKPGRHVQADRSTWMLEGDPTMWVDKLDNSYESPYHQTTLKELGTGNFGFPLTVRVRNLYVTLTEALVKDYGDLAVKLGADGALEGQLYADPQGWTTDDEVVQPWRVTIVARNLTDLVNTTLVENLNPPANTQLANADWVKPGRSAWQWLASGDPREPEQQQWIDWTSQLGFDYYLIDEGWEKWPDSWPSRRRAIELSPTGTSKLAKDAADAHLMVDFHGANKPSGMDRTWPNVITREGVRGHEYQITRYHRVPQPDHDVILPFTRYIAGPGDYTPTVFATSELMGNTWSHELAQAIVFTSPFLCFGGHPQSYLENPARDVLTAISPVWDETRILSGSEPGKVVAEARRTGKQWLIAVMNGADATTLDIPLDFLGPGTWSAVQLRDAKDRPDAWDRQEGQVTSRDHIELHITARGGFVGWLRQ